MSQNNSLGNTIFLKFLINWTSVAILVLPALVTTISGAIFYSRLEPTYVAQFDIILQGEAASVSQLGVNESSGRKTIDDQQLIAITPAFQRHTYSSVDFELNTKRVKAFVGERLISPAFFSNHVFLKQSGNTTLDVTVAALGGIPARWRVNMITTDPEKTQSGTTRAIDALIKDLSKTIEEENRIFVDGKISQIEMLIERAKADIEFDKDQQIFALHQDIEAISEQIRTLDASKDEVVALALGDQTNSSDLLSVIEAVHKIEKLKLESQLQYLSQRQISPSLRSSLALTRLQEMKSAYEASIAVPLNVRQFFPKPNQPILMLSQFPISWQQRDLFGLVTLICLAGGLALGAALNWFVFNPNSFRQKFRV